MLPFIVTLFVVVVSYYIYARVVGLTWMDIKAGYFMNPPTITNQYVPALCKWGEWLPCNDDDKQMRYEVSDEEGAFECGKERKVESRECDQMCGRVHMPVCACTEYDMAGVCQTRKSFPNVCALGSDIAGYEAGTCER